jgi:hypothetical protein
MIPNFNHSHVLPPYTGDGPTASSEVSPYRTSMLEVTERFAGLPGRRPLLEGLLAYRADLAALGFVRGFQWLDGSFAEDVEAHQQRPPNDIDIVTFAFSPAGLTSVQINQVIADNPTLFTNASAKEKYGCDAYVVPLDKSPENLVKRTAYFFSLFSHRRNDQVWKGLLQIPLESDDALARDLLQNMPLGDTNAATA